MLLPLSRVLGVIDDYHAFRMRVSNCVFNVSKDDVQVRRWTSPVEVSETTTREPLPYIGRAMFAFVVVLVDDPMTQKNDERIVALSNTSRYTGRCTGQPIMPFTWHAAHCFARTDSPTIQALLKMSAKIWFAGKLKSYNGALIHWFEISSWPFKTICIESTNPL